MSLVACNRYIVIFFSTNHFLKYCITHQNSWKTAEQCSGTVMPRRMAKFMPQKVWQMASLAPTQNTLARLHCSTAAHFLRYWRWMNCHHYQRGSKLSSWGQPPLVRVEITYWHLSCHGN